MGKAVEIRNPNLGLNEDAAPGALDANESPLMVNILPHNPSAMERRGPYIYGDFDSSLNSGAVPVGIAIHGTNSIISYAHETTNPWFDYYRNPTLDAQIFSTASIWVYTGRYRTEIDAVLSASDSTAVSVSGYTNDAAGTPDANILLPYGRQAAMDDVVYYPSLGIENTYVKEGSTTTSNGTGSRIVAWAGKNGAHRTSTNTSVNVGSTLVTFGTDPGTDIVGMFITFDSDRTTAFPFAYQIVQKNSTLTATIAKPYGLGVTGAVNQVGATAQLRSRDIPIQSPTGIAAVCAHLDRLFVGRARLRNSTGTLQPGYYPNALKWSKALNPEQWPDENVTLIGSSPNDAIMGLATVGRYLLIFKNYSTWILAGDSEDNFTVRQLLGNIGCIDSRSIVKYGENVIWASWQGVHMVTPNLDVTELTQRKPGHGVRRTYQRTIRGFGGVQVTAAVDANDYLHIHASGDYERLRNGTGETGDYTTFPMSCHIPTKAWTRLQGTASGGVDSKYAVASPRFYSAEPYTGLGLAVGHKSVLFIDGTTDPRGATALRPGEFGSYVPTPGMDMIYLGSGGSFGEQNVAYKVDLVYPDTALAGDATWQMSKLSIQHLVEYTAASTQAGTTGAVLYGQFDPLATNTNRLQPATLLGGFKARITSGAADAGQTLYVVEINPRTTADEDAMRGQFLRLRVYDASTAPPTYWNLFRIAVIVDAGRDGRGTDHLL